MLTKSDINKLKEIFATKEELILVEKRLEDKFLTGLDAVMSELKSMREEIAVMLNRQTENTDKLANHETRITKVEEKLSF